MSFKIEDWLFSAGSRLLAEATTDGDHAEDAHGDDHGDGHFGVHITYDALFASVAFLAVVWSLGKFTQTFLKMPSLVGEIFAGILLGPPLAGYVPNPEAFVMLGEIGLILLVLEAGIDVDLTMLKLIGTRGFLVAIIGSILPIVMGVVIAFALGYDAKTSIGAGACFGPTSLGIAMNILQQGKLVNTPVGQLIISAAVIDDMIALIILSQLKALSGPVQVTELVVPIVSAFLFLGLGGYLAIAWAPTLFEMLILKRVKKENRGQAELGIMLTLLIVLMPATYYARASFLMGAFLAGLSFCKSHDLHVIFGAQFKRILQWLMRIFFAASIGFQVPITSFGSGKVIWQALVLCFSFSGKVAVGFLVPNFSHVKRFTESHLRDCLITGYSMAAEGEFAFVIAVFAVSAGIIDIELYAAIVLAVLLSTIVPPFLLRFTIAYYKKKAEAKINEAAEDALNKSMHAIKRNNLLGKDIPQKDLEAGNINDTMVFFCIQTKSQTTWGLMGKLMGSVHELGLEMIDHRSWHPPRRNTLINEIYVKDRFESGTIGQERIDEIGKGIAETIRQNAAKIKVSRWYPGVLQQIKEIEEVDPGHHRHVEKRMLTKEGNTMTTGDITKAIMDEAAEELQLHNIISENDLDRSLSTCGGPEELVKQFDDGHVDMKLSDKNHHHIETTSYTPIAGGDLFDRNEDADHNTDASEGLMCTLTRGGETFQIRIADGTFERIRSGYGSEFVGDDFIAVKSSDVPDRHRLEGFIRTKSSLGTVTEDTIVEDKKHFGKHNSYTFDGEENENSPKRGGKLIDAVDDLNQSLHAAANYLKDAKKSSKVAEAADDLLNRSMHKAANYLKKK